MNIVTDLNHWQTLREQIKHQTIGFVPTMGQLHAGHLSLCKRAQLENDVTVISIFVNPTQFNQPQDFARYPRNFAQDISLLTPYDIDFVLHPSVKSMYPDNTQIALIEDEISLELEGEFRPGHFNGMLSVVLKLLNLIQPMRAYFGEKDYQQLLLIKKMVDTLFLPLEIIACPTVRDIDGLALSSRNLLLDNKQRAKAALFPHLLQSSLGIKAITEALLSHDFKVDYIAEKWKRRLGAVWIDQIRLIDNISL